MDAWICWRDIGAIALQRRCHIRERRLLLVAFVDRTSKLRCRFHELPCRMLRFGWDRCCGSGPSRLFCGEEMDRNERIETGNLLNFCKSESLNKKQSRPINNTCASHHSILAQTDPLLSSHSSPNSKEVPAISHPLQHTPASTFGRPSALHTPPVHFSM